jgi:hypothetical protein
MMNMRVTEEAFGAKDLALIFIAAKTAEAREVERILTDRGIDYCLGPEEFMRQGALFVSNLRGVGFYVVAGQAGFCRDVLKEAGFGVGVIESED